MIRSTIQCAVAASLALCSITPAFAQTPPAPLRGSATCHISVSGPGYSDRQTQVWKVLEQKPTISGAMHLYSAEWSVTGSGSLHQTQGNQTHDATWTRAGKMS